VSDFVVSLIRTNVPILVGGFIGWLVSLGVTVPEEAQGALTAALVVAGSAAYYAAVRALEKRWPWFGYLLGSKAAPTYEAPARPYSTPL
jgi:hypothetical protein